jgi:dihydroneopterin aldolase
LKGFSSVSDYVNLENVILPVRIGTNEKEREIPQPIEFQVKIEIDASKAGETDSIHDTINYVNVYEKMKEISSQKPYCLLERLCALIVEALLELGGASVWIKAKKVRCPIPGMLGHISVEIERHEKN